MDGIRPLPESLYERDFAAWAAEQGRALRAGDHARIDWENVIEQIETQGRTERASLRPAIPLILEHMLKFDHGLNDDPKAGWKRTIRMQRRHARKTIKGSPSLKPAVAILIGEEYDDARDAALDSFEVHEPVHLDRYRDALPELCPYTQADMLG